MAILVAAVAMNDVFTIGQTRQIRIAEKVNELCKQNLSWLLKKMKALGFRVMPDGRVVYALDETGKAVRF